MEEIQIILKTDWDTMVIKKSPTSFIVNVVWIQIVFALFAFFLLFAYGSLATLSNILILIEPLQACILLIGLLSTAIYLGATFFAIANARNTVYVFESARVKKMGDQQEQIPAKLIVQRADILKRITTYDLSEYKRVNINQGPLGMMFNFGSLIISNEEPNEKKQKVIRVRGIADPANLLLKVQETLDDSQK